jgi:hypothetical protein
LAHYIWKWFSKSNINAERTILLIYQWSCLLCGSSTLCSTKALVISTYHQYQCLSPETQIVNMMLITIIIMIMIIITMLITIIIIIIIIMCTSQFVHARVRIFVEIFYIIFVLQWLLFSCVILVNSVPIRHIWAGQVT